MRISVIIPTLNEAEWIEHCLEAVGRQEPYEIVVADGGSSDGTPELAEGGARVVRSERGRAHQLNAGAAAANGEILLFIHADTVLPPDGLSTILEVVDSGAVGGVFRLKFDYQHPLLAFSAFCTRLHSTRIAFGDRALFSRASSFSEIGGFPGIPIFEDIELADKLARHGDFAFLDEAVTTSARRYRKAGVWRQQFHNTILWSRYRLGASPETLAAAYTYPTTPD